MTNFPDYPTYPEPEVRGWLDADKPPPSFRRWLRARLRWLASPRRRLPVLVLLALLLLALGLGTQQLVAARAQPPAPVPVPVVQVAAPQLRSLLGAVEECRGTESLLVMLPPGGEREAAVSKLQRHQRQIDAWLRDNGAWLAASHGQAVVVDLQEVTTAWRGLQQRIVQAEVVLGRNGLVREPRALMIGPSADAYRHLVTVLERLSSRDAR